jgi:serine/threonine protein kinase
VEDELHEGTVLLGRFEVTGLLGRGGSATVHRADDLLLGREVALKVVARGPSGAPRTDGIRLLAGLDHPNLVRLHEVFDIGGSTVLVLELVQGTTLADLTRHTPIDLDTAASIGAGVADALHHVHARGVVHRDVTPANVLVLDDGRTPRLTDFGIAGRLDAVPSPSGTVRYLSPEQARGDVIGPASDVYSLGLTLAAALGGRHRLSAALPARVFYEPPLPRELPYGWRSLLTAMTAREPGQRLDAAAARERFETLGGTPHGGLVDPTATGEAHPARTSS